MNHSSGDNKPPLSIQSASHLCPPHVAGHQTQNHNRHNPKHKNAQTPTPKTNPLQLPPSNSQPPLPPPPTPPPPLPPHPTQPPLLLLLIKQPTPPLQTHARLQPIPIRIPHTRPTIRPSHMHMHPPLHRHRPLQLPHLPAVPPLSRNAETLFTRRLPTCLYRCSAGAAATFAHEALDAFSPPAGLALSKLLDVFFDGLDLHLPRNRDFDPRLVPAGLPLLLLHPARRHYHLEFSWLEALLGAAFEVADGCCTRDAVCTARFQHLEALAASAATRIAIDAPADEPEEEGGDEAEGDDTGCDDGADGGGGQAVAVAAGEDAGGGSVLRVCESAGEAEGGGVCAIREAVLTGGFVVGAAGVVEGAAFVGHGEGVGVGFVFDEVAHFGVGEGVGAGVVAEGADVVVGGLWRAVCGGEGFVGGAAVVPLDSGLGVGY
ncbi:hypothetical protein BJ508DRAFT_344421 [Ascobolus immersus RN42]|uniref:Uncharacterized protein n=1 Tax=Ascobolus immersus RN42 TaxID=1160509 RepID=A0A3N4HPE0_ASCIM|nr:hypothetical protein BJ508DRAFT_344421 [Ascobolus immersus RN42]